jgi:hypothetical protein
MNKPQDERLGGLKFTSSRPVETTEMVATDDDTLFGVKVVKPDVSNYIPDSFTREPVLSDRDQRRRNRLADTGIRNGTESLMIASGLRPASEGTFAVPVKTTEGRVAAEKAARSRSRSRGGRGPDNDSGSDPNWVDDGNYEPLTAADLEAMKRTSDQARDAAAAAATAGGENPTVVAALRLNRDKRLGRVSLDD